MSDNLLCDNCSHKEVCKNKDVYKKFQEAVRDVYISVPTADLNADASMWRMVDVPWLKPTKLDCVNYDYQRREHIK